MPTFEPRTTILQGDNIAIRHSRGRAIPVENISFRTWLGQSPDYRLLVENSPRSVERVIRLMDRPNVFAQHEPEYLTHEYRLALTLRYISHMHGDDQTIFRLFGVNRRTRQTFEMIAREPKAVNYYKDLQQALSEIERRKQERTTTRRASEQLATPDTLAELASVEIPTT